MTDNEIAEKALEDAYAQYPEVTAFSKGGFIRTLLPFILSAITASKQEKDEECPFCHLLHNPEKSDCHRHDGTRSILGVGSDWTRNHEASS